jgi:hypothetical protein
VRSRYTPCVQYMEAVCAMCVHGGPLGLGLVIKLSPYLGVK